MMVDQKYQPSVLFGVWSHLNKAVVNIYGWSLKQFPRIMSNLKQYAAGKPKFISH